MYVLIIFLYVYIHIEDFFKYFVLQINILYANFSKNIHKINKYTNITQNSED